MLNVKNVLLSASILMSISTNCTADTRNNEIPQYAKEFLVFVAIGGAGTMAYKELEAQKYSSSKIVVAGMSSLALGESLSLCLNIWKNNLAETSHKIIQLSGFALGAFLGEALHRQARQPRS